MYFEYRVGKCAYLTKFSLEEVVTENAG